MSAPKILFLVRRIGPYHDARFAAVGRRLDLVVAETRPASAEYPWTTLPAARGYLRDALPPARVPEDPLPPGELRPAVAALLARHTPAVVACSGWADPEYHVTLAWCHRHGVPAIVMSDSTRTDEPRRWWRERLKRSVVGGFAGAVVAGARSAAYLRDLDFPAGAIARPLDVVDNDHFGAGADGARAARPGPAAPPRRFLCVARFIPKKNHARLLAAFAAYVHSAGEGAWDLMLCGSGPLEPDLRAQVTRLGLGARVIFAGFRQYPELPALYAGAGALVLPSLSDQWGLVVNEAMACGLPVLVSAACGCAPELVEPGGNGWVFPPEDVPALAAVLARTAGLAPDAWAAMGRRSRALVAGFSPESFAQALADTVVAVQAPARPGPSVLTRAVIQLMNRRRRVAAC